MSIILNWEDYKKAYAKNQVVLSLGGVRISPWAKEHGLRAPLFRKKQWLKDFMMKSEENYKLVFNTIDVHQRER
jgi:hypothetical protein